MDIDPDGIQDAFEECARMSNESPPDDGKTKLRLCFHVYLYF
jgi:hypothetical protein